MGRLLNIVNQLHRRTARDYVGRMADEKVHCSEVARRFDRDYWDGDRRYGYGGYKYDGRWSVVAQATDRDVLAQPDARDSRRRLRPRVPAARVHATAAGLHGGRVRRVGVRPRRRRRTKSRPHLFRHDAREPFPFADQSFDLVISLNALHNLPPAGRGAGAARDGAGRRRTSTSWSRASATPRSCSTSSAGR